MKQRNYYIYILTNKLKTVVYVGVTNNLERRVFEHENSVNSNSFTSKYNCFYLVYFERFASILQAIAREKEIKKWRREKKNNLVFTTNPEWRFLNEEIKERYYDSKE